MNYLSDYAPGAVVRFMWPSFAQDGASITRGTNGTIRIYKDGSTTELTTGGVITDTEDFDTLTGVHFCAIDTSVDATFFAAGSDFHVVLAGAVIDTKTVNVPLAHFSLRNRNSAAQFVTVNTKLDTIDDYVDTEVAAIKVKTDGLPADTSTLLNTIAGYIDTEVAAIKAKTDNLPGSPAAVSNVPTAAEVASAVLTLANGVELNYSLQAAIRLILSAALGVSSGVDTGNPHYRDINDTKDRIVATSSNGNRTVVNKDIS